MKSNLINIPVCPNCNNEVKNGYCYKCHALCNLQSREKKSLLSAKYRVKNYISTKTNAEIILENIETNEEYNVRLKQFFKLIKGLEYPWLVLQERKQGSAYSWEVIDLLEEK
jgi:hypothetical protein